MTAKLPLENCFVGTVTVGERGQVVIPAEARKKLDINTGDKLFMMSHPTQDGFMVVKIDAMREFLDHLTATLSVAEGGEAAVSADDHVGQHGPADDGNG